MSSERRPTWSTWSAQPSRTNASSPRGDELEVVAGGPGLGRHVGLRALSGVLHLARYSALHRTYPPDMLWRRIGPSLRLRQYRYFIDGEGLPAAFCNWAWLSPAVLREVVDSGRDLAPEELCCGKEPFFYEFLAPFGHCRAVARVLRDLPMFKGRRVPSLRVAASAQGVWAKRVVHIHC
jgi:cytolysin-activating lysine-acyltransferase